MKGKLRVVLVLIVIGVLLVPSLVLAQDTIGDRCVIIEGPSRTELGITGPEVIVGGVRDFHFRGPQIHFITEIGGGPIVLLPAVQYPPDPC
jgi:hypothetical protein